MARSFRRTQEFPVVWVLGLPLPSAGPAGGRGLGVGPNLVIHTRCIPRLSTSKSPVLNEVLNFLLHKNIWEDFLVSKVLKIMKSC